MLSDQDLLAQARRLQTDMGDWFASQQATDVTAEDPREDQWTRHTRLLRTSPEVVVKDNVELQDSYAERFSERAGALYDQCVQRGLPLRYTLRKFRTAENSVMVAMILEEISRIVALLEQRLSEGP